MKRRDFNRTLVAATGAMLLSDLHASSVMAARDSGEPAQISSAADAGSLTDVEGLKVGHWTAKQRPTGCTVVLCEKGAVAGVDVRGGAPGTRETDLLNPINTVQQIYGLVLSGGSAFGLDTASGVMRYLDEKGIGFRVGPSTIPAGGTIVVPIVPAAILIDLAIGDWRIRPNAESGYQACLAASTGKVAEGNVGAGAGATVGKFFDSKFAMKSGLGTASIRAGNAGIVVAAIAAVNAAGDVYDPHTAKIIAGARTEDGRNFRDTMAQIRNGYGVSPLGSGMNTTLGVVATNAKLSKDQATKIAQMAHDGLARTINPTHTPADGDTVFAVGTGLSTVRVETAAIGALAADVMAQAIVRAVMHAEGIPGYPSYTDLRK
jgi:L-aminopeptidase/D-esterase-like protein